MKRLLPAVVALTALVSITAVAQTRPGQTQGTPGQQNPSAQAQNQNRGQQMGVELPKQERQFAQMMHHHNQTEIRLGKLAEQKAQNQQVRDFAKMMVQDHQQADQQLQQIAQQKKWSAKGYKPQDAKARAMKKFEEALEAKLRQLDGAAFDQAYMAAMVEGHDHVIAQAAMAQQQYQGSELAKMMGELLPKLAQHREHAYRVLGQVGAPALMGVGGAGGGDSSLGTPSGRKPIGGGAGTGTQDSTNREGRLGPGGGAQKK